MAIKSKVKIIFGCLDFGRKMSIEETHSTINYLLSEGIKSLDTASMYANGQSEVFMGQHAACNSPDKTIVTTKGTTLS